MPESTEPSLKKPVASEAQSDRASATNSENRNSALQNAVEEQVTGEPGANEEEQKTPKELPRSDRTFAKARAAFSRGNLAEVNELVHRFSLESAAEKRAEKMAQERATEKQRVTCKDSADEEEEEDYDSEPEPDFEIRIDIGGSPGKTAGLTEMKDLMRVDGEIRAFRFVSAEDGVLKLFRERFHIPWKLISLYESLILPTDVPGFRTTQELFDDIRALFQKHVMLPSKECSLLTYWSIATWFTDYLGFLPSIVVSGPASSADLLLRTMVAVCRRPVLLAELNPAILRRLPINEITPTLLVREAQLNRNMSALLSASDQPGYLFLNGETFEALLPEVHLRG